MKKAFLFVIIIGLLGGCVSVHNDVLGTRYSQVETRNYQSRMFETSDRQMVLRSVIATMQDLGIIINKADETLGVVSGTSFANNSKVTVSVRNAGETQTVVRMNAQVGLKEISDPTAYQNFFDSLSQSLFLDANMIE